MSLKKIFVTGLTAVADTDLEGVGTVRWERTKRYKWVKFNTGTGPVAAVSGNVCYYHGDNGMDDQEVTMDLTDAANLITAGQLLSAPTNGQYCWILTQGYATLATALTAGADGNQLTATGATDGTLDVVVTGAIAHIAGYAVDASAAKVYLDCPL